MTNASFEERCARLLADLGIAGVGDIRSVRVLTGGVASDIGVVDLGTRKLCVKFALPKLKVAADWRAPVSRNAAEYAWLAFAGHVVPDAVPALYGHSVREQGFAMEYLEGGDLYLWKTAMLAGEAPAGEAERVADALGRIHAASTGEGFDPAPFRNADDFEAIRIEPYLRATARAHPALADRIAPVADGLYAARRVLVHGDVSPKNILMRDGRPVLLDAECATMGDPAFDVAFCLNHLLLKALHLPAMRRALLGEVGAFWRTYARHVGWEAPEAVEARTTVLLPILFLARVDGKSPVEYLDAAEQDRVRQLAIPFIEAPAPDLARLVETIERELGNQ